MSQHRLDVCLRKLEQIKPMTAQLKAKDFHDLLSCHEAEAMVLSAEMQFRGASMRKESRGWFLREDYPEKAEEVKWYTMQNIDGKMVSGEQKVPFEQYKYRP